MSLLPPPIVTVHEPVPDHRDRRTRKPLFFFDRVKVSIILVAFLAFAIILKHSTIPIMSWGEAIRDQLNAKWWVLLLLGIEIARQLHYLIAERSAGYNQFWIKHVWGTWN